VPAPRSRLSRAGKRQGTGSEHDSRQSGSTQVSPHHNSPVFYEHALTLILKARSLALLSKIGGWEFIDIFWDCAPVDEHLIPSTDQKPT
jgi:hypothetical protein